MQSPLDHDTLYVSIGTYVVLLTSWLLACAPFEAADHFGWLKKWRIQPAAHIDSGLRWRAYRMAALNWVWLPFALLLSGPFIQYRFPLNADLPSLPARNPCS